MTGKDFGPCVFVATQRELTMVFGALSAQPAVAVDTESNSFYAYRERVCLIQLSVPGGDYIVDPLAGLDLSPLGLLFADPGVQKVFHAAEYDLMCLKRDFGFRFGHVFDTMWAARILGWPRVGLADLLEERFGVHAEKRYQQYDWGRRPLDPRALDYARLDTHYLLALRDEQVRELAAKGRTEEAREVFAELTAMKPASHNYDPDGFWRVKGAQDLSPREQAVLRELYLWREREAERQDRPLFKIVPDRTLVALARAQPRDRETLSCVSGFKSYHTRRYGAHVLRAVERGRWARSPQPPAPPPPPDEAVLARYEALRAWRKRVAAQRGVDPDVVISNAVLWALARRAPRTMAELSGIPRLGPWKRETYGHAILDVLEEERPEPGDEPEVASRRDRT